MNFRPRTTSEPDINLIPFIDVLLVILIFLMLTTTYSRFQELQLNLPLANAEQLRERPQEIVVAVNADGQYAINGMVLNRNTTDALTVQLQKAAREAPDAILIVSADAQAAHQSVISVMEAARNVGLVKVTFATQSRN
ncbi:biopolymer transport protein ExbD [Lampropedia hyalina DSM 16112]|jgi:biopolymer transport protein ExbD|uniref:Biopolymer transport protein ExbD n=1 Tax=Lampropedia hyalina DSM 16112 TaxID=1122156 RepID=A0A1M4TF92_9BURK|nr:biopolymer transporter ExbD [Lampropedia hyalina]SHE43162.1 biopolymer transport protein ExbD [Lampropedia hyalina DSM 16112]